MEHTHDNEELEQIAITDEETGEEYLFEILLNFDGKEKYEGKSYMIVAPIGTDEENEDDDEVEVLAFQFVENDGEEGGRLLPIESDEEWDMVAEVYNTIYGEDE
jgi:uncharacterized protein YrzB (UPF0473 family)